MKRNWQISLGAGLVALSAALYYAHYLLFHDPHHIFIYMIGDIAFVPVEVLLVTLVLHGLLGVRERRSMLRKLNMVIGAFFSQLGTGLLNSLATFDPDAATLSSALVPTPKWADSDFKQAAKRAVASSSNVDSRRGDLVALRDLLVGEREFMLRLLENPNLLEHESFTDLLWAAFHLTEELASRTSLDGLPETDLDHLSGDIVRAYSVLSAEWLAYMKHLKVDYPYLYSLAMRTNPFDPDARCEVV